jgi:hypothetical protein
VLRTSAGVYPSQELVVRTHALTDLTGITITPGVMPAALRESLAATVQRIGAKLIDSVRIDTTHFVCVEPRGQAWEKAVESNIPVVVPDWVKGCEAEGRIVGVRQYYLDADPRLRTMPNMVTSSGQQQQQQQQQQRPGTPPQTPSTKVTPPTPETPRMTDGRPAVPPKDERNGGVGETPIEENSEDESDEESETDRTTLAETAPEGKGHAATEESDSEEEDDEEQEQWPGPGAKKDPGIAAEKTKSDGESAASPEAKGKAKKTTVEDEKEDDTSFQDVTF